MKKFLGILLSFLFVSGVFAQEDSIFNYAPKTEGYLLLSDDFSVQIIGSGSSYNVFNDIKGSTDVIAWKADKKTVTMIVRLRGFNTDGAATFYLLTIDGSKSKAKGKIEQIKGDPNLEGYILNQPKTNDSQINLRSSAGTSGKKVGQYQKNNNVTFTGKVSNKCQIDGAEDYWYSIDYAGTPAWIYGKYITFGHTASITLESLGVVKKPEPKAETVNTKNKSQSPDFSDIKFVVDTSYKVYSVFHTDNSVMKIINASDYWSWQTFNFVLTNADGSKKRSEFEMKGSPFVYNRESDKLFYVSELYDFGYPSRSEVSFINQNGEGDVIKDDKYNMTIEVCNGEFCADKNRDNLYFVSFAYEEDYFVFRLCRYNIKTGKISRSGYVPELYGDFALIDVINKNVFVFCMMGDNNKPEKLAFYKVPDFNGESAQLLSTWNLSDLNTSISYAEHIKFINFPNDKYAIMCCKDTTGNVKSMVFGLEKGDDISKYNNNVVEGTIFDSFQYDDEAYVATIEYSGNLKGTIRIYKDNLHIPVAQKDFDYSKNKYWEFCPLKAGINENGEVTVVFSPGEK